MDSEDQIERVLGVQWNPGPDVLEFGLNSPISLTDVTKRTLLGFIMKLFDPLGLLTPITVKMKILMRKLWSCYPRLQWDDILPIEIQRQWTKIIDDLNQSGRVVFNRSITPQQAEGSPVLVVFSDGSTEAYGAVAYVRWKLKNGGYSAKIVAARSRMAPVKTVDIVRIELCGAVLSSRLRATIEKEINIKFERVI